MSIDLIQFHLVSFATLAQEIAPTVFRIPTYVILIPVVIAVGLIVLSVVGFAKRAHPVICLIPLGLALSPGLLFAPNMYQDRVEVHPDRIQQTTGFFFAPNRKGFEYKEVVYVHIKQQRDRKNRTANVWEIHEKGGATRDIDPGDLWDVNETQIVSLLKGYGVSFR